MADVWTIGRLDSCEVQVDHPAVSGQHCRLAREGAGFLLTDLNSSNGTYVNGQRITTRVRVMRSDRITLGTSQAMPWPAEVPAPAPTRVLRIGREPDNDIVVPVGTVSAYHARVLWYGEPGWAEIEDLGSSNGTTINAPGPGLRRAYLTPSDTIYLGTWGLKAEPIFTRLIPAASSAVVERASPRTLIEPAPLVMDLDPPGFALPTANATASAPRGTLAEVARVPIRPVDESPTTTGGSQGWREELEATALPWWRPLTLGALAVIGGGGAALFQGAGRAAALAMAAVGLGLLVAVAGRAAPRDDEPVAPRSWATGMVMRLGQALALSLLAWLVAVAVAGQPRAAEAAVVMLLGSAAGVTLGGLVLIALRRAQPAALAAMGLLALMAIVQPRDQGPAALRSIAALSPARWTLEGLLLASNNGADPGAASDRAVDRIFPVETDQMGLRADLIALFAMTLGFATAAGCLVSERTRLERLGPSPSPEMRLTTGPRSGSAA